VTVFTRVYSHEYHEENRRRPGISSTCPACVSKPAHGDSGIEPAVIFAFSLSSLNLVCSNLKQPPKIFFFRFDFDRTGHQNLAKV